MADPLAEISAKQVWDESGSDPQNQASSAWQRELSLAGAAFSGIKDEAINLLTDPGRLALEVGGAAALTAGLTLAGRSKFATPAKIVTAALGLSFVKQAITDGKVLAEAAQAAWNTGENLEANKAMVASVVGKFTVDTVAFGLGGYGGGKLASAYVARNPFGPHLKTDGPVQISSNPHVTERPGTLNDSPKVGEELQALLGYRSPSELASLSGKTKIETRFGTAVVDPRYSPGSNKLSLYFDSPRALETPRLEFSLNSSGLPERLMVFNDQSHYIPSLLHERGLPNLARATGKPTEFAVADRFGKVDYAQQNHALDAVKASETAPRVISERYQGKNAIYVNQKTGEAASINVPLGTANMGPCSALIVIDKAAGKHYLAHVDHVTNPDALRASLKGFDLTKAEIYIMEGADNALASTQGKLLGSAQRALMALGDQSGRARMIEYGGSSNRADVVIHRGKIFAGANHYIER